MIRSNENKSILLVEDQLVLALTTKLILENNSYRVTTVHTGEEAVKVIDSIPGIDLILMDINLGDGMDGTEAAKIILSRHDIPLIFLSSHTDRKVVEKTEGITSYGYIVKDSGETVLNAAIKMGFRLHEAKQKIKDTEALLKSCMESHKDLVIVSLNLNFNYLYFNTAHQKQMQQAWGAEVTLGMNLLDCITNPEIRAAKKDSFDRALAGESHTTEFEELNRTVLETSFYPILNEKGEIIGATSFSRDITERLKKDAALNASEARYHTIVSMLSDGVVLQNKAKGILMFNESALQILGLSENQLLGITGFDPDWKTIHEDGTPFPSPQHPGSLVLETGHPQKNVRMGIQRPDGKLIWINLNAQPIADPENPTSRNVLVSFSDITERKKSEADLVRSTQAIEESERRYRSLLANLNAGVVVHAPDTSIILNNARASELLGVPDELMKGKTAMDPHWKFVKLDRSPLPFEEFPVNRISSTKTSINNQLLGIVTGESKAVTWLLANGQPVLNSDGEILEILISFSDITEVVVADEKLKALLEEKTILLKEVHHRIKNNVANIEGLLFLQMKATDNVEAQAALADAISRVKSMRTLYDKLLLADGDRDISIKVYLESLIDSVMILFPALKKIKVEKYIDDFTIGSKRLFNVGLICNELITNTSKYAFVNRDTGLIKISLTRVGKSATFTIQDNGAGLPANFQLKESKGFGLMLAKMLSEQIGGTLALVNENGTKAELKFEV